MRIVQLSDIHLSKGNIEQLRNYFLEALINDLKSFHDEMPIDIILFTGDLVDKGGESLGDVPFEQFKIEIINPIVDSLGLRSDQILFIPGNHDIERKKIDKYTEAGLSQSLDRETANVELKNLKENFTNVNSRIESFKLFEKGYHKDNASYSYSNNESVAIIDKDCGKVGIALINDSWRCSSSLQQEHHFVGYNQLFNARNLFLAKQTVVNIAVFHHPLNAINQSESEEIENILKSKEFDVAFFGHSHRHAAKTLTSSTGGFLIINGRSAFSNPLERQSTFQPGYNILDLNADARTYELYARKFIQTSGYRFDKDTDSLIGGKEIGSLPNREVYHPLADPDESNNSDEDLPSTYSTDMHRIVNLLIGKSLYPQPSAFIRELIQNSVDAINRVKAKNSYCAPKIVINFNTKENYVEVIDEGDGMTKHTIKNHFSVIGKSISQEFNDSTGHFNLISQFGIGFMSTFIVAEKVVIDTKNDSDEQIIFEIEHVFKGFNYLKPPIDNFDRKSGTKIRVYLKKDYPAITVLREALQYCRHIENLEIYMDASKVPTNQSWNLEGINFSFELKTDKHETKLGIGLTSRDLIASNSGFIIKRDPQAILPFRFPTIIGGEVNFRPKAIDFDMSRTNIMLSKKSDSYKLEISISLRKLFRDALESGDEKLGKMVLNYLHYYLQFYDTLGAQTKDSYTDFYSKAELITLCSNYTSLIYEGKPQILNFILHKMKEKSLNNVFYVNGSLASDYQLIVMQYLENQGYLILRNRTVNVIFKDIVQPTTLVQAIMPIAQDLGMSILEISQAQGDLLKDMKMDKSNFHEKLQRFIAKIENQRGVTIEIGKFSTLPKPSVRNNNQFFLNHDHVTFQSLLTNIEIPDEIFEIYLLGLLGLQLIFK